jgi:hypothetical protein
MPSIKSDVLSLISQGQATIIDKIIISGKFNEAQTVEGYVPHLKIRSVDANGRDSSLLGPEGVALCNYNNSEGNKVDRLSSINVPFIPLVAMQYELTNANNIHTVDYIIIVTSHGVPITLYGGN